MRPSLSWPVPPVRAQRSRRRGPRCRLYGTSCGPYRRRAMRALPDRTCRSETEAASRNRLSAHSELHVLPRLATRKAADVTRHEIVRLHHELRSTPYSANRVLALLSKMFNLAEAWGIRPDGSNPCRHVVKYREHARERMLSADSSPGSVPHSRTTKARPMWLSQSSCTSLRARASQKCSA